ncbi:sulfur oxidation c-type cytochrome SoxA [Calidithermus timidus]|jgi:sulfur-oxidizing protein SoxA|uniref:sulfur oxidation c-type cytochrome SoxA n=1 Tax=Calidithermus timidus TaxID=307124 RepID=UPI0003A9E138|nr:sulfur oxidation c-type cytochrome SoxA [Calidithermus timidus]
MWRWIGLLSLLSLTLVLAQGESAQNAKEELARQKELLRQTMGILPTELVTEQGKEVFLRKGPSGKSMEACDFGLGPGIIKGAMARLPRYFPDSQRVDDLDTRIVYCMTQVQGFKPEEVKRSDVVAAAFYIASQSSGEQVRVTVSTPQEQALYALGEKLFYARSGKRDVGCATCHVDYVGRRAGPLFYADVLGEDHSWTHWPAYRYSNDQSWTMEDRIRACYGNLGHPRPDFYSAPIIALELFMAQKSNGAKIEESPAFVR